MCILTLFLLQPELKEERQKQLEVWETLARKRSLENIQFIGELFKLKVSIQCIFNSDLLLIPVSVLRCCQRALCMIV